MKRAMVAIGVDKPDTPDLQPLKAAAAGAKEVAAWGTGQGFDVLLLTDETAPVSVATAFKAVKSFVDAGTYEQLVLYFSGHGILLSPDSEVWVLSGGLSNPNETVNVRGSITAARTCRIPHVVVVSDACRSMPANFLMGSVSPGSIFPTKKPIAPMPEVDVFYATLPGDVALELPPDQAEKRYKGLLTNCMLKAFKSAHSSLVDVVSDGTASRRVIASRRLKNHLLKAIPAAASAVCIQLLQDPDLRVESDLPKYLAQLPDVEDSSEGASMRAAAQNRARSPRGRDLIQTEPRSPVKRPLRPKAAKARLPSKFSPAPKVLEFPKPPLSRSWEYWLTNSALSEGFESERVPNVGDVRASVAKIVEVNDKNALPGFTGIVVHGIPVTSIRVTGGSRRCILHRLIDGSIHTVIDTARTYEKTLRAAHVRFDDGSSIVISVLTGYVATVIGEGGRILTVNYTPSKANDHEHQMFSHAAPVIEESRALVATLARHGSLRFDAKTAAATAEFLRNYKRLDPTLGLFAAYAYFEAGLFADVASVIRYMRNDPPPLLFDVALLATHLPPGLTVAPPHLNFAPWMPMLTQGWMLLGKFALDIPKPLDQARRFLKPGLWTTFMTEGTEILESTMFGRELP